LVSAQHSTHLQTYRNFIDFRDGLMAVERILLGSGVGSAANRDAVVTAMIV